MKSKDQQLRRSKRNKDTVFKLPGHTVLSESSEFAVRVSRSSRLAILQKQRCKSIGEELGPGEARKRLMLGACTAVSVAGFPFVLFVNPRLTLLFFLFIYIYFSIFLPPLLVFSYHVH